MKKYAITLIVLMISGCGGNTNDLGKMMKDSCASPMRYEITVYPFWSVGSFHCDKAKE